ncbi:hypothetical protein AB4090_08140 [Acidithiobacillus sp. IBUN Pt1247-S3]|uniref:hypothetical protein n=1 Tax=Acidithiobacillus sp. IBUN Pt1247-S3 TaxID=3166642 RepID=UPI0034E5260D
MTEKNRLSLAATILSATLLAASSAAIADPIDLQLNIGTPAYYPPAVVAAPPLMVWLSNLGVYAAYGSSQPIFYSGSSYYYYYGNRWWMGPAYRGPWRPIAAPPPGLRRWNPGDWQRVQHDAGYYARNPHWRHFRPQARPQPPIPQQYRPQGPEHGPYRQQYPHGAQWQHGGGQGPQGWNRPGDQRPDHGNHGRGDRGQGDHGPGDHGHGHGQPWQNQ